MRRADHRTVVVVRSHGLRPVIAGPAAQTAWRTFEPLNPSDRAILG
jgi:hypothetical protein